MSLSLPDLEELGRKGYVIAREREKWGVGCLRGELLCQTLGREGSWDPPATLSLHDPCEWMGDLQK